MVDSQDTDLRKRPSPSASHPDTLLDTLLLDEPHSANESTSTRILHTLEDFQSRIHYDPNDKPPGEEPLVKPKDPNALLLRFEELPPWRQDNEFIRSGYRRTQYSFVGCAKSVFGYIHNETVNIHTHFWGAVVFLLFLSTFYHRYIATTPTATWADVAVVSIFLAAAVTCLSFSAFYHTCEVHSRPVASSCNGLDYAGIVVLIVGSVVPCVYYGFYCDKIFQTIYLAIFAASGSLAAYIVLNPEYRKPTHRGARTKVFVTLGLCGALPVTHGLFTHGFQKLCVEMGFGWMLTSAVLYLNGAVLYANRIPERLSPGSFDILFSSHQIFHVHVLLAALAHYRCVLTAFAHWHGIDDALVCLI